jgi:RNA polymerase sigma-70 factor (ECF subfamily)
VIALNRAVAIAMGGNIEDGLRRIEALRRDLDRYYLFHAARADLLRRLRRDAEAKAAYAQALELATNPVERRFLERRMSELEPHQG